MYNGVVNTNYGKIEDCQVKGLFMGSGITNQNHGEITRCLIIGSEDSTCDYGIAANNSAGGKISHCRVRATICPRSSQYNAGLVGTNDGLVENCTMNGKILGSQSVVYLVGRSQNPSQSIVRKSVAGKDASGAYCQKLFG